MIPMSHPGTVYWSLKVEATPNGSTLYFFIISDVVLTTNVFELTSFFSTRDGQRFRAHDICALSWKCGMGVSTASRSKLPRARARTLPKAQGAVIAGASNFFRK
jgi:hypothetical protein